MTTMLLGVLLAMHAAAVDGPTAMPARFEAGMVYVDPVTVAGTPIHLYTDSGGGLFVVESLVKRLALKTEKTIIEFSIWDTRVTHDSAWLTAAA